MKKFSKKKIKKQEDTESDHTASRKELREIRKAKRSYIQMCSKGNDHYTNEKLKSLAWLKKDNSTDEISKIDYSRIEEMKKKKEILQKYNQLSKEIKP